MEKPIVISPEKTAGFCDEISGILSALEGRSHETLKTLLRALGTIAEYSTEKEVVSVAYSTISWLEKTDGGQARRITAENLIEFAKLSPAERKSVVEYSAPELRGGLTASASQS